MTFKRYFFCMLLLEVAMPLYATNGSSTHGGDGVRITFAKGRDVAANMVESYSVIDGVSPKEVSDWIQRHKRELMADIRLSKHLWKEENLEHDAMTSLSRNADITFSRPYCSLVFNDQEKAAELLIHESVHHLGEANEVFADAVAISVLKHYHLRQPNIITRRARWLPITHPSGASTWQSSSELIVASEPVDERGFIILNRKIQLLDFVTRKWSKTLLLPQIQKWSNIFATSLGDEVLIWGNQAGKSKAIIFAPRTGKIRGVNESGMPHVTQFSYRLVARGKFVIWGSPETLSYDGFHVVDIHHPQGGIYDIESNTWAPIPANGTAPKHFSDKIQMFWSHENTILICCNVLGDFKHVGAVFDPSTSAWLPIIPVDGSINGKDAAGRSARFSPHSVAMSILPIAVGNSLFMMSSKRDKFTNQEPTAAFFNPSTDKWKLPGMTVNSPLYGSNYKLFSNRQAIYAFNTGDAGFVLHALDLRSQKWEIKTFVNESVPMRRDAHTIWTGESLIQLGGKISADVNQRDFGVMIDVN